MPRVARLALIASFATAVPAFCQAPELGPTNVYELSRALREGGQAEMALEYLSSLTAKLPKDQQADLALERAKARLDLANQETVEAKRDDQINAAKKEFEDFLKAAPNHPRAAEANISLARVSTMLGKAQLSRAAKIDAERPEEADALRKAEAAKARPFFQNSAAKYADAAKILEQQATAALAASVKRELTNNLYQALLDQGINQYYLGDSYVKATAKAEVTERSAAYKAARILFNKLAALDPKHPLCWVAKAWEGECGRPMQELNITEKVNEEIRAAAVKEPNGPPAAGYRMSRFFVLSDKWQESSGKGSAVTPAAVRKLAEEWLKDYRSPRPTTEHYAVMYYVAFTYFDEGRAGIKVDAKTNAMSIPDSSRNLLARAERDFRVLSQSDNDYKTRAAKYRYTVMRILVGDANKSLAAINSFDECHMAMLVTLDKLTVLQRQSAKEPEDDEDKQKEFKKKKADLNARIIALLNREKDFPVPKDSAREAADSQITMIYIYRQIGRTYEAAVMAEALARSSRVASTIAKAGENAVYAYLDAARQLDASDEESKAVDEARALKVAAFLDTAVPEEPATEEIRLLQAKLLNQSKRYMESFEVLSKISLASPSLVEARLLQGGVAYELLRYKSPTEAPANKKDGIRAKAVADLARVPEPSKPADAAKYVRLKLQLAQLHLTGKATGYAAAEKVAADTAALIPKLAGLGTEEKKEEKDTLLMQAEMIRIDAVYGQAMPLFNDKKYAECAKRFEPMLTELALKKPAVNDMTAATIRNTAVRLDAMRLDRLIMPSLNARARLGEIEVCSQLLDMSKRFGGDVSKNVAAVYQVIEQAKFQVDDLKAQNKLDESNALMAKVTGMLNVLLQEPNMTAGMKYILGKACKDLGDYPKAVELLKQVPKPANLDPKPPAAGKEDDSEEVRNKARELGAAYTEDMKVVNLYRAAMLELGRVYRVAKMIPAGEAHYDEILGKATPTATATHRRTGWASKTTDFRKEYFAFCEMKAANTPDEKAATATWVEAIGNWDGLVNEYVSVVKTATVPEVKDRMTAIYYDTYFEATRCAVAANATFTPKSPERLNPYFEKRGKAMAEFESKNPKIPNAVRERFRGLLAEHKGLEASYKANGGLGFPPAPETDPPVTNAAGVK